MPTKKNPTLETPNPAELTITNLAISPDPTPQAPNTPNPIKSTEKSPNKPTIKTPVKASVKPARKSTVKAPATPIVTATQSIPSDYNTVQTAINIVETVKNDPSITHADSETPNPQSTPLPQNSGSVTPPFTSSADNANQKNVVAYPPIKDLVKQYDSVSLLLQGGGALGAYQAGIYEGIHNQGIHIDQISGISIGALNTAIIAGNLPENRIAALHGFWNTITTRNYTPAGINPFHQMASNIEKMGKIDMVSNAMPWIFENGFLKQQLRALESSSEAFQTMIEGQKGFFKPRYFLPFDTTPNHLSYYTTDKLRDTLAQFCDLNLVNDVRRMKVSVSAVNVRTGNFAIFSNENEELHYDHFIASGALPPGFPAVEIDGEYYWDGGMVSNTPLNEILSHDEHRSQLVFQVDLWDARGQVPENMMEIDERVKDIQYSSKTRMVTDFMAQKLRYTRLIKDLLEIIKHDKNIDETEAKCIAQALNMTDVGVKNVIHLIYHKKSYERGYKDYEFSGSTMLEHWQSGLDDIENTFRHPDWFGLPEGDEIFVTHDIHEKRQKLSQGN